MTALGDSRRWSARGWTVERVDGPASELLAAAEPAATPPRVVRIHSVSSTALVLGSTQRHEVVDAVRAAGAGAQIVRRRSGGGAVLLRPGAQVWADFFVAESDPLWCDDIVAAAAWVGELWAAVVQPRAAGPVTVHSGGQVADRWGSLVCFAGRGPGEVFVDGLKVVGVSQRRNRRRARIQSMVRLRDPAFDGGRGADGPDEVDLLDLEPQDRLAGRAVVAARCGHLAASEASLTGALLEALPTG